MAVYKQPWAEVEANIIANSRGGDLGYELDEARQMWDMDSTPVAPQTRRETRRETISEAIDAVERDSRLPPVAPIVQAQADIYSSDEGDKDYQMDEAYNYNQSDAGKEEFADFRNTGDNSLYYNDDATRTDYAGEGNPTLDVQRQTAINTYGNSAAFDSTSPPAPNSAPPPAPPMAPARPTPTMQAFQAARLRKAAAPIDFTPSQAVSGYQSGGYTGGTSNG